MALRKLLILRKLRSSCLEGRTTVNAAVIFDFLTSSFRRGEARYRLIRGGDDSVLRKTDFILREAQSPDTGPRGHPYDSACPVGSGNRGAG